MTLSIPVRYAADVETINAAHEDGTVAGLNAAFDEILKTTSKDYGHAVRAVHAKAHAIMEGALTIDDGLPEELAQGMFAKPGKHKVFLRISTNAGDLLSDAVSLPRGLAVKVLAVEGERLLGSEGTTQDFVMVNGPVFQVKTADQFLGNLKMLAKTTDVAEGAKVALSSVLRGLNTALTAIGVESPKVQSLGGAPNVDPLGETYYSVTPFRYGDYIAKFSLKPISAGLIEKTGHIIDASGKPDAIRDTVRTEMAHIDAEWELRVQLCRDLQKQPIEDPTVEWNEADAPFQRVGAIRVVAQDSWQQARVKQVNEQMRFSVWTGLAAHRPLGNINRVRKGTYRHSAEFRAVFNRCPIHEPSGD